MLDVSASSDGLLICEFVLIPRTYSWDFICEWFSYQYTCSFYFAFSSLYCWMHFDIISL